MAPEVTAVHKGFVGLVQEGVQVTYPVEGHFVYQEFGVLRPQTVERIAVIGIHHEGGIVKFFFVLAKPADDFAYVPVGRRYVYALQVVVAYELILEFGAGFRSGFGVVLRDELLFVLEGYERFFALEDAHCAELSTASATVTVSSSVIYGCMGSERTRSHRDVATGQRSFASLGKTGLNAVCKCMGLG